MICSTGKGKKAYGSMKLAQRAVDRRPNLMYAYKCRACPFYHTTSQGPRTAEDVANLKNKATKQDRRREAKALKKARRHAEHCRQSRVHKLRNAARDKRQAIDAAEKLQQTY